MSSSDGGIDPARLFQLLLPFSYPFRAAPAALSAAIVEAHARRTLRAFLARHGAELAARSSGLDETLARYADAPLSFAQAWHWSLGRLLLCDEEQELTMSAAAQVGLEATRHGVACAWQASLPVASPVRWGSWLLPPATALRVTGEGGEAQVEAVDERGAALRYVLAGPAPAEVAQGAERLQQVDVGPGLAFVLLPRRALPDASALATHTAKAPLVEDVVDGTAEAFRSAVALLHKHAPPYVGWIGPILSDVCVQVAGQGRTTSGSASDTPGMVAISDAPPLALAEMLVHEASHQYLHLLLRMGPIQDGSDTRLYRSAATRTDRPLEGILAAYHAFGNIVIALEALAEGGADVDGYCERSAAGARRMLRLLEEPLRDNPALSPIGKALVAPLMDCLDLS